MKTTLKKEIENGISFKTIFSAVLQAQQGAEVRILDEVQVHNFAIAYRNLRARARAKGIDLSNMYLRIDGGGVPNSYRYNAETTAIIIDGGVITVARTSTSGNRRMGQITGGLRGPGNGGIKTI